MTGPGKAVFRLDGRTAVITGGGSGIGEAIALRFGANGAKVCVLDVNQQAAEGVAKRIRDSGGTATAFVSDVTQQIQIKSQFSEIAAAQGFHVLVNNAGVSHIGTVETTTEADIDRVFAVNVKGFYNCLLAGVGLMKNGGGGVILNMASIAGSTGIADRFAYSASKGAVIAMTYSVAKDYLTHKIRCNCISPARVHTPFVDGYLARTYPGREKEMFDKLSKAQPIGRMASPDEVAALALYLCSEEASFITGMDYMLDGGFTHLRG